jgi:ADP-ribose pyrophosphatase YjhB (NUDIX family)
MVTVVLAVVEHAGKFLLIQESKERVRGKWNLPGGRVEPGESIAEAITREVREESGIDVFLKGLLHVDQFLSEEPHISSRLRFVFRGVPQTHALKTDPDEHSLRAEWFTLSDLGSLSLRNVLVRQMIDLAAVDSPALPMSSVRLLGQQEYNGERREEERDLTRS